MQTSGDAARARRKLLLSSMSNSHGSGPRRPPPLQALRALESAVRLASYTQAAEELAITQSAVSHQLRELETLLGEKLFRRAGRNMLPTARARAMADRVREALQLLESAIGDAPSRRSSGTLNLSVLPSFAAQWLLPRLGGFHARHPQISLHIRTSLELADFRRDGVDAAIRFGAGRWDGCEATLLAHDRICAVVSPRFANGRPPLRLQDLQPQQLIGNPFEPWTPWLRAAGLDWPEPKPRLVLGDAALVIAAAASGQGVALTRELLARDELQSGRLMQLSEVSLPTRHAYWLAWPLGSRKTALIKLLGDWMAAELARAPSD